MQRKKPFSGKQKKAQLQEKRLRKASCGSAKELSDASAENARWDYGGPQRKQPASEMKQTNERNRLDSVFLQVPAQVRELVKRLALLPHKKLSAGNRPFVQTNLQQLYPSREAAIQMPQRPKWTPSDSKETVERREQKMFAEWLLEINSKYLPYPFEQADLNEFKKQIDADAVDAGQLMQTLTATGVGFFESNLEVYRQLWRVVESSDVVVVVADVRFPLQSIPLTLVEYILGKQILHGNDSSDPSDPSDRKLILALTKIDLVPQNVFLAWKTYLEQSIPEVTVVGMSFYDMSETMSEKEMRRRKYKNAAGVLDLIVAFRTATTDLTRFDSDTKRKLVSEWDDLIDIVKKERILLQEEDKKRIAKENGDVDRVNKRKQKMSEKEHLKNKASESMSEQDVSESESSEDDAVSDILESNLSHLGVDEDLSDISVTHLGGFGHRNAHTITIGFVGCPNAGKSALLNALMRRKVVSVSRTAGHTRHFQTHFVSTDIVLCDCPGVVFPARIDKRAQVAMGFVRTRDAVASVGWIAERFHVFSDKLFSDIVSDISDDDFVYPFHICEEVARKLGYMTKGGRYDVNRAANLILKLCFDGKIPFYFVPTGFVSENE